MPKGKEITVSNVTDKEYYRLSQAAYHYKMLALHMKYKTPIKSVRRHIGTLRKLSRILIRVLMPLYSQKV